MKYFTGVSILAGFSSLVLFTGCGGGQGVTLQVGSIPSAAASRSDVTDAAKSSTAFAYAKVDGVKLQLTRLQTKSGSNEKDIVSWSPYKEVTIAPGTDNTLSINEEATVDAGTYTGLKVRYNNSYSVKAFCRTSTYFVYTTAAGIVRTAVGSVTSIPSDYDYYSYPFAELTTATTATGTNSETMAETNGSLTISESDSLRLAVLFDPSYLVTCYDGTGTLASNSDALAPFNWSNNNGVAKSAFFPDSSANFGIGYIPIFIWSSSNASEALPTAETYGSSLTAGDLSGATLNYADLAIVSFAFNADGSLFGARARIGSSGGSNPLYQMFSDYSMSSSTYSFKNGEWQCNSDYSDCGPIQDRSITGFTRTTDYTSTSSATYTDGPDCGQTIYFPGHSEWGNQCRSCLGSSSTLTWRQLVR
jgi:hypothetical protein